MNVSVFSLLMSVLWSSLIILVAHLLRRKAFFLRRVGAPVLVVFYLLSVGRMVLPVEFPFSREVPLRSWFSTAVQAVCIEEHQLGDFGWTWAQAACVCWAAVGIILLLWFFLSLLARGKAHDPVSRQGSSGGRDSPVYPEGIKAQLESPGVPQRTSLNTHGCWNLPTEDYSPLWRHSPARAGVHPPPRVHPLPPWRPVGEAAHSGVLLLVLGGTPWCTCCDGICHRSWRFAVTWQ